MAAPLLHGERALGVLTVLDRPSDRPPHGEMELLVLVAQQGAIALDVVERARERAHARRGGEAATLANLARALNRLEPDRREPAVRL